MIGTKFEKSNYDQAAYTAAADWCNANNAYIKDSGDYYEVVAVPAPTLEEVKAAKLTDIDIWTAGKITGGFTSSATGTAVKYDSDEDTQLTMQGIGVNADKVDTVYPDGVPVRGYVGDATTKAVQYLTGAQIKTWLADMSQHIGTCKQAGWAKQTAVAAAATVEEVDAIILD